MFMPETKSLPVEEIVRIFEQPVTHGGSRLSGGLRGRQIPMPWALGIWV